jgi:hypothetical protein
MFTHYFNEHDQKKLEPSLLSHEPFATKAEAGSDPCSGVYLVPLPCNSTSIKNTWALLSTAQLLFVDNCCNRNLVLRNASTPKSSNRCALFEMIFIGFVAKISPHLQTYKHSSLTYKSRQPFGPFLRTVARDINCLFIGHALFATYKAVSISVESAEW